jgi:AcrR family transcriptional regulator
VAPIPALAPVIAMTWSSVKTHAVAQSAGVGQGTLYRHFPTREDWVLAVYHADVEHLIATAAEPSAAHPPREAMRCWLAELAASTARFGVHALCFSPKRRGRDDLGGWETARRPVTAAV